MRFIDQESIAKKRVLLRVDFNVSLLPNHHIADDLRIRQSLPTIAYLLKERDTIFLISHLGRPHGFDSSLSLRPLVSRLESYLPNVKITFAKDVQEAQSIEINPEQKPQIILLENIRFNEGEEKNSEAFAKELASLADMYVNDAFGVSHRKCASITQLPLLLPSFGGLLLKHEIEKIESIITSPKKPFVTIIGGAKMKGKIELIESLIEKSDIILLGGALANTFLKAVGNEIGKSLYEPDEIKNSLALIKKAEKEKVKLLLPLDAVVGDPLGHKTEIKTIHEISAHERIYDIGPQTQATFAQAILDAKTIIWNGPMGLHEVSGYEAGTDFIFYAIAANNQAKSLVGGGDTLTALKHLEHLEKITHLSTGGGALLSYIEKGTLVGIEALQ